MNREIKFRGKSIMNNTCGDWLYSSGIKYGDDVELMYCDEDKSEEWNYIDKETLGQYTGLHDKNGKEIYEGDIVGDNKIKWIVKWNKYRMGFSLYPTTKQLYDEMPINVENKLGFKILGNIYDNPELLGGE